MRFHTGGSKRALLKAHKPLLAAIAIGAAMSSAVLASAPALADTLPAAPPISAGLTMNGVFAYGLKAWTGVQCANYGTPSTGGRLRGTLAAPTTVAGIAAGVFTLPSNSNPLFNKEACEVYPALAPLGLGTTKYYGYMFYVKPGFNIGTTAFWGIVSAQLHFQGIWGAPLSLEMHNDHVTLALQVGACHNSTTSQPGCAYHTNADNPGGNPGNLPKLYAVPPGGMTTGWHELLLTIHWAGDNTGSIQISHRMMGSLSWTQTVNLTGYPTVQYNAGSIAGGNQIDKIGAYRASSTTAVSLPLGNFIIGSAFNTVAANLP